MAKKNKSNIGFDVDNYEKSSKETFDNYKERLKALYEYEDALQEKNYIKRKKLEKEFNEKRKKEFEEWLNSKHYSSIDDITTLNLYELINYSDYCFTIIFFICFI